MASPRPHRRVVRLRNAGMLREVAIRGAGATMTEPPEHLVLPDHEVTR